MPPRQQSLGGLPSGDLFAVANAIASLLDAPITIEDRSSRVLAFSGRQDEADPSRVETILGRQVPERYSRILTERGVFRELHRSDRPVFISPIPDGQDAFSMPRVAIAVRAGDEVLGSIWAAVPGPLSEERTEALCESAKLVALHLLRVRAGADVQRRLRADLLSSALEGGTGARDALDRLGLTGQRLMVLGVAMSGTGDESIEAGAAVAHERQRLSDAFALHLSAVHPGSAAALVGGVTYGLVPLAGSAGDGEERAVRIAHDFLDRVGDRMRPVVGVGPVSADLAGLALARACTDRALRVLRQGRGERRVARLEDIQVEALILELRDLVAARGDRPTGPLARLIEYDRKHQSNLVETLQAWLDAFGDVTAAADALFLHPNTFRYRLRRVAEVGEINLARPRGAVRRDAPAADAGARSRRLSLWLSTGVARRSADRPRVSQGVGMVELPWRIIGTLRDQAGVMTSAGARGRAGEARRRPLGEAARVGAPSPRCVRRPHRRTHVAPAGVGRCTCYAPAALAGSSALRATAGPGWRPHDDAGAGVGRGGVGAQPDRAAGLSGSLLGGLR